MATPAISTEAETAERLLEVVRALSRELHPGRRLGNAGLDASLDSDFGLDSLSRAELLARIERGLGVRLSDSLLGAAETPRDLLAALLEGDGGSRVAGAAGSAAASSASSASSAVLGPAEAAPERTRTLLEVVDWHAERHPDRRHILFDPGDAAPEEMTCVGLLLRARAVAAGLAGLGVGSGEERRAVGIMLPTGLDYFAAFLGAQLAGGIPVPLYPPTRRSQIEDHLRRQAGILDTAQAAVLVTFPEVLPLARLLRPHLPGLKRVVTVADLSAAGSEPPARPARTVSADDIAFLQFTSGSTGQPKGVVLTHANLLANLRAIGRGVDIGPDDVVVSWLPLYHDMGLIGSWMGSLYFGMPLHLMSPLAFLARPSRWLWAIHHHRGTLSPAPNFAYELCAGKIPEGEIEGLDLSSWRVALNGAEPVSPEAIRRFSERFAPHGFRAGAMAPVYGLAECSLAVAFPPLGRGPLVDAVERETFQRTGRAVPAAEAETALRFVSCGLPLPGHEVRIVDASGRELPERQEGRLEFRGPSATSGYFRNPEATRRLLRGDWRDSGDRAYLADGEIYVTGRDKDILIRAGRNVYPHELEEAAGEIPGVRKGCVAVFGVPDAAAGTERIVVLAETREEGEEARERLRREIQERAVDLLGGPADEIVLAPPHSVPKTSSGKVRRAASRELYESGRIGRGGAALGWQLTRLAASGVKAEAGRRARVAADLAYGLWMILVTALLALPTFASMVLPPGLALRRRLARGAGRLLALLTGTRLSVEGLEHLAGLAGPAIVAANHASYLDVFALTAALPPRFAFVAKRELEGSAATRLPLRGLGTIFVERFDAAQGAEEARKVEDAVRAGGSLVIFPEGTFHRAAGLRPFRLGAFLAAVRTGAPVVPVTLVGTRSKLRGGTWLPRPGGVAVTIRPPVRPDGDDWAAAVRLRESVRARILADGGEPDLAR
jgi:1-acyl-sn-glycerol-3-phosphate acyltransferase